MIYIYFIIPLSLLLTIDTTLHNPAQPKTARLCQHNQTQPLHNHTNYMIINLLMLRLCRLCRLCRKWASSLFLAHFFSKSLKNHHFTTKS